jgi:energy-coupling factor transport system permease protein
MLSTARGNAGSTAASRPGATPWGRSAQDATGPRAGAWLAWLAAASIAVFLTSNPLYLATACLVGLTVYASIPGNARQRVYGLIIKVGLFFALLSIPFNLLTGSAGPTVLFELPRLTFPGWLGGVTLGGAATAESLMYAIDRALRLVALLLFAAAFNVGVDHYRLLRLMPSALKQMGVVITVSVLLIPQAVGQARAVMEAQRLRGRAVRGLRSLAGLTVPVLAGALERSLQRAESLDARGFGSLDPAARGGNRWTGLLSVGGLGLAACGAFAYFYYSGTPLAAGAAMMSGVVLAGLAVRAQGAGAAGGSRYSQEPWTGRDGLVVGCALLSTALLILLRVLDAGDATYIPYPSVTAPAFHPLGALAFLLLLAPALASTARKGGRREDDDD